MIGAIALVTMCLCFVCACQGQTNNGSKVVVKDLTGKEFKFDDYIKKVVSTHNPTLNHVVVLGNGTSKYLAGFGNKDKANGLYSQVLSDWDQLTLIGGQGKPINKETIISLKPDLALVPENLSKMADDDWGGTGVEYFVALPQHETIDSIPDSLKLIAELFGEQERANTVSQQYYKIIDDTKNAVKDVKDSEKPKVLFMGSQKYKVATGDMIQTQIIENAGGKNAAEGQYENGFFADSDAETIVKMNPDVIWFPNYAKFSVDDILNDEKLQSVNAVKNKKVYKFPCNLEPWDYPTCSTSLGFAWAANNLYPQLYSHDKLVKVCNEFYQLLYNKTFTAEQMGI